MTTQIAIIRSVSVNQDDDGRVHWISGAAVDADGANGQNGNLFAYRSDDSGLDVLADAGYPNGGWRNVLVDDGNGNPTGDSNGNLYSQTTYTWPNRPIATRYVDATTIPYVVVNPIVRQNARGIIVGAKARVSFNSQTVDAVVADVSGANDIGEISIAAARLLAIPDSPRSGGVPRNVSFEIWPGNAAVVQGETYRLQPG